MIRGAAIVFGLFAMGIVSVVGGWLLLVAAQAFLIRFHAMMDYISERKTRRR